MKNTEYSDVFDFGEEVLSIDNKFSNEKQPKINTYYGSSYRGMDHISARLANGAVSGNSDFTTLNYFIDSKSITSNNGIQLIADPGSDPDKIKITEADFTYNPKSKDQKFAYKVKIYTSTSARKLEEAFKNTVVGEFELLIFVEDNSSDKTNFIFGAVSIGNKLKENLINGYEKDVQNNKTLITYILDTFVTETGYFLEKSFVEELLKNGKAEYPLLKTVSFVHSVIDFISFGAFQELLNTGLSSLLSEAVEFINKGRIADERWNPNTDKKFDPLLYPIELEYQLNELDDNELNVKIREIIKLLTKNLKGIDSYVGNLLKTDPNQKKSNQKLTINEVVYRAFKQIYSKCHNLINNLENFDLTDFYKTGIRSVNAFICGLWNSLIDSIVSIIEMIKMLIDTSLAYKEMMRNLDRELPRLIERIEEAIQAWEKFDVKQASLHLLQKILNSSLGVDAEHLAYYIGYFYGFIISIVIEIIIGLLISGGVISLEIIMQKLSEQLFGFFTTAAKSITKAWKKTVRVVGKSYHKLIEGVDTIIDFFEQGIEKIKKLIDEVFDNIEKYVKTQIDDFIKKLPKKIANFIDSLPDGLQKKFINGLLKIHFNNRKLLTLDPKGIIVEIEFIRNIENKKNVVSEIKNVTLKLDFFDYFHNKTTKKYIDDIEVIIAKSETGVTHIGFNPIFKEGKIHDADFINQTYKRTEKIHWKSGEIYYGDPPYATTPVNKAKVLDRFLKKGDEFYIVEFKTQKRPGAFATDYKVKDIKELREKLAVKKAWKNEADGELFVRKYRVKDGQELKVREGYIGEMFEDTKGSPYYGKFLEGGPKQWEFIDGWDETTFKNYIEKIEEEQIF